MRTDDAAALGALAGAAMAGTTTIVEDVHRAVMARTPAAGSPIGLAHDTIAGTVYGAVRGLTRALGHAAGAAIPASADPGAPRLADGPRAGAAIAALNAARGDDLERDGSALALAMTLRAAGTDVELSPAAVAAAYPGATSRVVVFVHGLGETERAWHAGAQPSYGDRLRADLGLTPVELRFNTGLPVERSGRDLAALLERLAAVWPREIEAVALVGHSMGGLVARAAASADPRVTHVICLASPHGGAPLEKGVEILTASLLRIPEAAPFAAVVDGRSAGIKDLRHGPRPAPAGTAQERYVTATVTRDPRSRAGRLLGDVLVRRDSAAGGPRRLPAEHTGHIAGAHHFAVLNHPEVYAQLRAWLSPPEGRATPGRRRGTGPPRRARS